MRFHGSSRTWPRLLALVTASLASGCSDGGLTPEGQRGKQIYLSQCIACHAADPSQAGPVGPPVKGVSRDVLEAKVVRGTYPPGYTPKRATRVMAPQPELSTEVASLAEFLK